MAQTILVVDDDPVQRRLLETAITRSGMSVVTAPGGQPALDLIGGPRGEQITLISYAPFDLPSVWREVGPVYIHAAPCDVLAVRVGRA